MPESQIYKGDDLLRFWETVKRKDEICGGLKRQTVLKRIVRIMLNLEDDDDPNLAQQAAIERLLTYYWGDLDLSDQQTARFLLLEKEFTQEPEVSTLDELIQNLMTSATWVRSAA